MASRLGKTTPSKVLDLAYAVRVETKPASFVANEARANKLK
jgi:hypothetical protein